MARFRGLVQGARGLATRLGHDSMTVRCDGWNAGVRVEASVRNGVETFTVLASGGSNGVAADRPLATVAWDGGERRILWLNGKGEIQDGAREQVA